MDLSTLNVLLGADGSALSAALSTAITQLGSYASAAQNAADKAGQYLNAFAGKAGAAGSKAGQDFAKGFADANAQLKTAYDQLDAKQKVFEQGFGRLGDSLQSVGKGMLFITGAVTLVGGAAVAAAAKLEGLEKGLQAVTLQELGKQGITGLAAMGLAADQTKERLKELREVANLPGLGFAEAVQGDIRLRAVGISAELSKKALLAFGNAVATTGGGKNELDRITTQLGQLSSKGKVLSSDLRPIIEAAPAVAGALQKLYGTVDSQDISAQLEKQGKSSTDFINILTTELGKLPQVSIGLKGAFENLKDSAEIGLAKVGDSIAKALDFNGLVEKVNTFITALADSFANLSPGTQSVVVGFGLVVAAAGPVLLAVGSLLSTLGQAKIGFAVLGEALGPVVTTITAAAGPIALIVGALAALAVGTYYVATASDRALDAFDEQSKAAKDLTNNISPLLDRYDELAHKGDLNATEQQELAGVIEQVAKSVPGATSAIDQYGKTTAISTKNARELIAAQQELARTKAANAIDAQKQKLVEISAQYAIAKRQIDEFNSSGSIRVSGPALGPGGGAVVTAYKAGSQAVLDMQESAAKLNVELLKQQGVVQGLENTLNNYNGTLKDTGKTLLETADLESKFFGAPDQKSKSLDSLRQQAKELKETFEGLSIDSPFRADVVGQYKAVEAEIAKYDLLAKQAKKTVDELTKAYTELQAKLNGVTVRGSLGLESPFDAATEKVKLLQDAVKKISDLPGGPGSQTLAKVVAQLRVAQAGLATLLDKLKFKLPSGEIDFDINGDTIAKIKKDLDEANLKARVQFEYDFDSEKLAKALLDNNSKAQQALADNRIAPDTNATTKNIAAASPALKAQAFDKKSVQDYNDALADLANTEAVFGRSFDAAGASVDVIGKRIKDLLQIQTNASNEIKRLAAENAKIELDPTLDPEKLDKNADSLRANNEQLAILRDLLKSVGLEMPNLTTGLEAAKKAADWSSVQGTIEQSLEGLVSGGAAAVGQALASLAKGGEEGKGALESFFNTVLSSIGSFLQSIGGALIAYGIAMDAFKKAFSNPYVAIAAGAALIVLGGFIGGLASSGPSLGSSGSSSSSFNSGATSGSTSSSKQNLSLNVTFKPAEFFLDGNVARTLIEVDSYRFLMQR